MLRVEGVSKSYGRILALEAITLEVRQGEIITLIGPSGCGKTTLLRIVAGFERPDRGTIWIDNVEVSSARLMVPPHMRKLSMIFQDLALWPHMTALENIQFVLGNRRSPGHSLEDKAERLLNEVNLGGYGNRYPHELSGGEKQRLAIARALATRPRYVLMDEPFSDLDHMLKDELKQVILELNKNSTVGILYVTHNVDEALTLADRLAIMRDGRIEQSGTVADVTGNAQTEFVRRFLRA
jgi:iron(III) transport system ATP-binding protein